MKGKHKSSKINYTYKSRDVQLKKIKYDIIYIKYGRGVKMQCFHVFKLKQLAINIDCYAHRILYMNPMVTTNQKSFNRLLSF